MFTGLVREIGTVERLSTARGLTVLDVRAADVGPALSIGDSLAVDGICLTVTALALPLVRVEASFETRRVTTLGSWRTGRRVHLEPSLRVGDPLGGHFVLGHVDGVGTIRRIDRLKGVLRMTVTVSRALGSQLLPKGSIAVDGVSLTLDEGPFEDRFTVTLIPHTLASTHFADRRMGQRVNVETDVLAKNAVHAPGRRPTPGRPLTVAAIRSYGWNR